MSDLFNSENMEFLMENELINFDENGMVRTPHGQWRWYHHDMKFLFEKNEENWIMNYDTAQRMKNEGYDLSKITKIVHCQTLEDPTHSPTAEEAKKLIEFQVRFFSFVACFIFAKSNLSSFCEFSGQLVITQEKQFVSR